MDRSRILSREAFVPSDNCLTAAFLELAQTFHFCAEIIHCCAELLIGLDLLFERSIGTIEILVESFAGCILLSEGIIRGVQVILESLSGVASILQRDASFVRIISTEGRQRLEGNGFSSPLSQCSTSFQ